MEKNLMIKVFSALVFTIIFAWMFSNSGVDAASINSIEEFEKNVVYELDKNLEKEERIMEYDAITGKTREVDVEELKEIIENSKTEERPKKTII